MWHNSFVSYLCIERPTTVSTCLTHYSKTIFSYILNCTFWIRNHSVDPHPLVHLYEHHFPSHFEHIKITTSHIQQNVAFPSHRLSHRTFHVRNMCYNGWSNVPEILFSTVNESPCSQMFVFYFRNGSLNCKWRSAVLCPHPCTTVYRKCLSLPPFALTDALAEWLMYWIFYLTDLWGHIGSSLSDGSRWTEGGNFYNPTGQLMCRPAWAFIPFMYICMQKIK